MLQVSAETRTTDMEELKGEGNGQAQPKRGQVAECHGEDVTAKSEMKSDAAPNTAISNGMPKALETTMPQTTVDVAHRLPLPEGAETTQAKQNSPPRLNGDEPKSTSDSELPALLRRLGPTLTEPEPIIPKSSLLRNAPMLSRLPPRPRVDTWIAADVKPPRPHTDSYIVSTRARTDSYIAPRSPSPKRYEGQANNSDLRRRDRSPIRVRHDEGRLRDGERFARTDDSLRRVQRSPREADHFSSKRRRTEGDGHRDEREDVRRESQGHRSRDILGRHDSRREEASIREHGARDGHDSKHEHGSHPEHKDSRQHPRRGDSAERKPHTEDRASSEARRHRRRFDHRDDRTSAARTDENEDRRGGDDQARRSTHEGDRRDAGSQRGRKDVEDCADARNGRFSGGRDIRSGDIQERRNKDAGAVSDRWRIQSSEVQQRNPLPQNEDHHGQQDSGVDSRQQELHPTSTKERQQSPRREYEGGKALPSTIPRNGSIPNGMGSAPATGKPQNSDMRAPPRGPKADTAPNSTSTARVFPYQQPALATPVTRNQRPIPQSLSFNRNAFNNKPYARSATSGSNSEPLTARRGFETPPASAPPVAVQPHNHVLKDNLDPPLQDKDYIISQYPELKNLVKPVWIENPKAPVANFLTGGKGGANGLGPRGPAYRIAIGRLGGKPITRAKLPIVGHPSIIGIGDDCSRIQAEKLACLSALFQLIQAGLMKAEEQPAAEAPEASESPEDEADSEEVTQLSTGETITLRDARAFMDYYCKRFGFGQPEISYETVAMRAGPSKWEAIMEVGGKKIGLGAGSTKKMATRVCYLDVTSYLEKCDQALWREYLEYSKAQV